ncbi:MAG: hypothetical protein MO846_04920 [Candidatus Devosia symbiotica]|nr:hypothetical protein [Candidatus Devosia symbiotica]
MAQSTPTFLEEMITAAQGSFALLTGNRKAPTYFDFSQRGLVGSFIALVIGLTVQAFGPRLLGIPDGPSVASSVVMLSAMVVAIQIGVAYVVLRMLGHTDSFLPFVVVQNWANTAQCIIAVILTEVFGPPFIVDLATQVMQLTSGIVPFVALGVASLIVWVNIARLVLMLRPRHVALFVIAQLTAAFMIPPFLGAVV